MSVFGLSQNGDRQAIMTSLACPQRRFTITEWILRPAYGGGQGPYLSPGFARHHPGARMGRGIVTSTSMLLLNNSPCMRECEPATSLETLPKLLCLCMLFLRDWDLQWRSCMYRLRSVVTRTRSSIPSPIYSYTGTDSTNLIPTLNSEGV